MFRLIKAQRKSIAAKKLARDVVDNKQPLNICRVSFLGIFFLFLASVELLLFVLLVFTGRSQRSRRARKLKKETE